jgi:hypothetical protein
MCKRCSDQHQARIEAQRKATKQRRALRQFTPTALVLEEDPAMTDTQIDQPPAPSKNGRVVRTLTDEQEVEILDAYTKTDEPVHLLSTRFGVNDARIYRILDRVGVSWRRGNHESFTAWQASQQTPEPEIPEAQHKALENMLKLDQSSGTPSPFPTVLPARPEPVAPTPSIERRANTFDYRPEWKVNVVGLITVQAEDIESALKIVRGGYPNLRITGINQA